VALTLIAFEPAASIWTSSSLPFLNLDDNDFVAERHVRTGLTLDGLGWALTTTRAYNWFPLTWISFEMDATLYGQGAAGYHRTNVLLHTAAVVLLFLALDRMTNAPWRCAVVAALFAVHPLRVESVAWVAERKDVLYALFWMLSLLAYAWYTSRPTWSRYLAVLVSFALGLMSKPMTVTLPAVLLLLDWWPLGRLNGVSRRTLVRLGLEKAPFFLLAAGVVLLTLRSQNPLVRTLEEYPLGVRVSNAVVSYVRYLALLVWPADLAVFYPHPGRSLSWWYVTGCACILLALTAAAVRLARLCPYFLVGWLWFLGTLVPTIGLVQLTNQAMANRFTYIPSVGVLLAVVWGIADLAGRRARLAAGAVAVVAVGACIPATWMQLSYWRSNRSLWTRALEVTGDVNPTAHNHLGGVLLEEGDLDGAEAHFVAATRQEPTYTQAWYNLGLIHARRKRPDLAVPCFEAAVRSNPGHASALHALGLALEMSGRSEEARACFARERAVLAAGATAAP
jgi:hypothetical protein